MPEYIVWYLPYGTSAETLSRTYDERTLPPYELTEGEIVDFVLNEIEEIGDPFEIRRKTGPEAWTSERVWVNHSWGID